MDDGHDFADRARGSYAGSQAQADALAAPMQAGGTLLPLNRDTHPGCWRHRSDPGDVACMELLTLIGTPEREDAGPDNHWMAPRDAHASMDALCDGAIEHARRLLSRIRADPASRCTVAIEFERAGDALRAASG